MRLLLILLLVLMAKPGFAASLQLEDGACDMLVKHVSSPNVDYQPGTDAYGRKVAGANLAPEQRLGPVEIPLTVDLANRLHLGGGANANGSVGPGGAIGQYGNEAYIGTVTIDGNTVLINGQPITDETEDNLAILCMHANPQQ